MSRIPAPAPADAAAASQPMLGAVQKQLDVVPSLIRLDSTSPLTLKGYLGLSAALDKVEIAASRSGASNDPMADAAGEPVPRPPVEERRGEAPEGDGRVVPLRRPSWLSLSSLAND